MDSIDVILQKTTMKTTSIFAENRAEIKETAKKLLEVLDGVEVGVAQKALVVAKTSYKQYATNKFMDMKLEIKDYNPFKGS